jgi:hypothetical protein
MKLRNLNFNLLESFFTLISFVSFILALIAMGGSWKVFSGNGKTISIGLWQICSGNDCSYSWSYSGYNYYPTNNSNVVIGQYIYYNFTPGQIATAQGFYIIGVINHIFISCCALTGLSSAIFGTVLTAFWYTIAYACAAAFFLGISGIPDGVNTYNGYGAVCGTISFVFIWISTFGLIACYFLEWHVIKSGTRNEADMEPANTSTAHTTEL